MSKDGKIYGCFFYFGEVILIKELEEKILREGQVLPGEVLKVGSFLNQQIDVAFLNKMGEEVARLYEGSGITKVLTVEASGIALAYASASALGVPMAFAKKHQSINLSNDLYTASVFSYTHQKTYDIVVSKEFLNENDIVLVVDDFLANGNALKGLMSIVEQAGAKVAGAAIAIEKGYQKGGDMFRESGLRVESLAIVEKMTDDGQIFFREQ